MFKKLFLTDIFFSSMTPCLLFVQDMNACQSALCQRLQNFSSKTESFKHFFYQSIGRTLMCDNLACHITPTQRSALKALHSTHIIRFHLLINNQSDTLLTSPTFQPSNCRQYHILSVYYCIHDPHSLYVSWANVEPQVVCKLVKRFVFKQKKKNPNRKLLTS